MRVNIVYVLYIIILFGCAITKGYSQSWEKVDIGGDYYIGKFYYNQTDNKFFVAAFTGPKSQRMGYYLSGTINAVHWEAHRIPRDGAKAEADVRAIWGSSDSILLATTDGPLQSTDDGENWYYITNGLDNKLTQDVTQNSTYGPIVGTASGPYYYEPFVGWTILDNSQSGVFVYDVYAQGDFLGVSSFGVYSYSFDNGQSWHYEDVPDDFLDALAYHKSSHTIFYCNNDSLFRFNVSKNSVHRYYFGWGIEPYQSVLVGDDLFLFGFSIESPQFRVYRYNIIADSITELDLSELISLGVTFSGIAIANDKTLYIGTSDGLYRTTEPVVTSVDRTDSPLKYQVSSYPSPVAPGSPLTVSYSLERAATLSLQIKDILGRTVRQESLGRIAPGQHTRSISTAGLEPGMYFYSVIPGTGKPINGKMIVR